MPSHKDLYVPTSKTTSAASSRPLFPHELSTAEIQRPNLVETIDELVMAIRQHDKNIPARDIVGCEQAIKRNRDKREPFFALLYVWNDGNWTCIHLQCFSQWNRKIPPGQFESAYWSSLRGKHFYSLETSAAKDLQVEYTNSPPFKPN
ncbi:hypothetical protein NBRC116495_14930 [Aurantivibrio plasticivorans]